VFLSPSPRKVIFIGLVLSRPSTTAAARFRSRNSWVCPNASTAKPSNVAVALE
jgi:hypothetical protein